jgi:hypothetical protein
VSDAIDDRAATRRRPQRAERREAAVEDPGVVDLDQPAPQIGAGVGEERRPVEAGVVHDVEPAVPLDDPLDHRLRRLEVGDVVEHREEDLARLPSSRGPFGPR